MTQVTCDMSVSIDGFLAGPNQSLENIGAGERLFDGVRQIEPEPLQARHTDLVTHPRYRVVRTVSADR